jgi:putative addiction module component (TIGR02574 family)
MSKITLGELSELTVAERIELAQDLWDSVTEDEAAVPVTPEQQAELDRRLEAYEKDPEAGAPWEVVKARLKK